MKKVLFIIAFIILSNPIISNVDILPDFLAYALIMLALSKPTYYDQKALSAYRCARNMLFMSVLRLVSFYLTTVIIDASLSLVFSFALFVVEMVFGIPFIIKLFDYFGDRALKTDNKFALKVVDKFKIVTIVLFSLRLLLSTLPDFILLTVTDPLNDMSRFRPVLIVLAVLASLIVTLAWIPLEILLIARLFNKKESELAKATLDAEVKHKALQYGYKAHKRAFILIGILVLSVIEIRINNLNVMFNTALPLVFIATYLLFLLLKYIKVDKMFYVLCGVTFAQLVANVIARVVTRKYFESYTLVSIFKVSQAETMYYSIIPLLLISSLLFLGTVSLMLYLLIKNGKTALEEHTPILMPNTDSAYTVKDYVKKLRIFGIITTALCAVSSVFTPIVFGILPHIDSPLRLQIFGLSLNLYVFQWAIPLQMLFTGAFIVMFIATLIVIYESSYKKLKYAISLL